MMALHAFLTPHEILTISPLVILPLYFAASYLHSRRSEKREKNRVAHLEALAAREELEFFPSGKDSLIQSLSHFRLFSIGRSKATKNVFYGRKNNAKFAIFDYSCNIRRARSSRTYVMTVMLLQDHAMNLPSFEVRPSSRLEKILQFPLRPSVELTSDPAFRRSFWVDGEDEKAVQRYVNLDVRRLLMDQTPRVSIEAGRHQLLIVSPRLPAAHIDRFLDIGLRTLQLFREAGAEEGSSNADAV